MSPEEKQAFATELAQIAIVKLASSAQGSDLYSVFKSFGQTETQQWLAHMAQGWPHYGKKFIACACEEVSDAIGRLKVPPQRLRRELIQAKVVLGKGAPNWRRLHALNFNPGTITSDIANNSRHGKTNSPFSSNHVLFNALYSCLPRDDEAYAELDRGINHQARKLLLSNDAVLKEVNEMQGWGALLTLAGPSYNASDLTPARLLDPVLNIVPYQRHRQFEKTMKDWLDSPQPIAIKLFGGQGGSGKTRAMLELCMEYSALGWCTAFLNEDPVAQQFPNKAYEHFFQRSNGVLIVVDHAQDRHKQLNQLLSAAHKSKSEKPVRIVLLSRSLSENWLTYFHALASPETEELIRTTKIEYSNFPAIAADSHLRHAIYKQASIAFAAELNLNPTGRKSVDLDAAHFRHPLYICIAAMLNLHDQKAKLPARQLILELLRLEQKQWRRPGCDAVAVAQAMALITLWQGAGKRQITRMLQLWPENAAARHANPDVLLALLDELYGLQDNTIAPLRPDVVGEQLVTNIITKHMRSLTQISFSSLAAAEQRKQTCNIISRLPVDKIAKSDQLAIWLSDQLKSQNDVLIAAQMIERFPDENSSFAHLDERAAYIVRKHLINQYTGSIDEKIALSLILNYHGVRLAQQENMDGALKAIRPATKLRRELVDIDYEAYIDILAESLSSLSSVLTSMEKHDEAATGARETVRLNRHLAGREKLRYLPELAWSLTLLGHNQFKMRELHEALNNQREAVNIYRDLILAEPDNYLQEMAQAVLQLSEIEASNGLIGESLKSAQEAANRYRQLSLHDDAYLPDLSTSLNLVADAQSSNGQHGPALETAREATRLDRRLSDRSPRYRSFLARSLGNLANIFSYLEQHQNALNAGDESVAIYRQLAQRSPHQFSPLLADGLSNLSFFLSATRRLDGALKTAGEAVVIRRNIAADHNDAFSPELASALINLSNAERQSGEVGDAISTAQEATSIYQALSKQQPERFTPELSSSLGVMGQAMLKKRGQTKAAMNCFSEAVFLLTPHFELNSAAYSGLMSGLVKEYYGACEAAKKKPDKDILEPVERILSDPAHILPK